MKEDGEWNKHQEYLSRLGEDGGGVEERVFA